MTLSTIEGSHRAFAKRSQESLALNPTDLWIAQHPVLSALAPDDQALCLETGSIMRLQQWDVLHHPDRVLFVLDGFLGTRTEGSQVGLALAGAGSVVWPSKAFNSKLAIQQLALSDSAVLSIARDDVREAFGRLRFSDVELRQSQAMFEKMVSESICNAEHLIRQRLAKWLLRFHFAASGKPFELTQTQLAHWLGAQRTTVNQSARLIAEVGGIKTSRGKISINDAAAVEAMACNCVL